MLRQKIQEDISSFVKQKKQHEVDVLRSIFSSIRNVEIDKKSELNDEEILKILKKYVKDLVEANKMFEAGGRNDLVEQNELEIDMVAAYMPPEISEEEIEREIRSVLDRNKDETNRGKLIGLCVKELSGKADGGRIAQIVQRLLSN